MSHVNPTDHYSCIWSFSVHWLRIRIFTPREFTEKAIYTERRIEHLRTVHDLDLAWLKTMFDLLDEVEHLCAELRFFRNP